MRIAHSTTVTPFLRASSLTSRSRVCSRMRARAAMCSDRRMPSSSRMGKSCSSEGGQDARTDSIRLAEATLVEAASETDDDAVDRRRGQMVRSAGDAVIPVRLWVRKEGWWAAESKTFLSGWAAMASARS